MKQCGYRIMAALSDMWGFEIIIIITHEQGTMRLNQDCACLENQS